MVSPAECSHGSHGGDALTCSLAEPLGIALHAIPCLGIPAFGTSGLQYGPSAATQAWFPRAAHSKEAERPGEGPQEGRETPRGVGVGRGKGGTEEVQEGHLTLSQRTETCFCRGMTSGKLDPPLKWPITVSALFTLTSLYLNARACGLGVPCLKVLQEVESS